MNLRRTLIIGVKWTTFDAVTSTFIQFIQNIVLARLLKPDDFGVMAIIMVIIGFIHPVFDLGLGTAIIQNRETDSKKLSTLYWLNILLGLFCFLLVVIVAFLSNYFFNQSGLEKLIITTSLIFLIAPWGSQYAALIAKELKFELQAKISIVVNFLVLTIAIGLALNDVGVYTLILAYISKSLFSTCLNVYFGSYLHKPQFYFNPKEVTNILRFGLFETGSSIVNYFSANIDKILIGGLLGTYSLGLYTIAWNLVLFPLRKINPIVTKIIFPLFSKISQNQRLVNKYFQETMLLIVIVSFPILLFLAINAEDILYVLYGDKWLASSLVLSILTLVGLLKSFANPGGSLMLSKGRSDIGFYWNIGWSISLYLGINYSLFIQPSIESVAMAQLIAGITLGMIWHLLIVHIGKVKYNLLLKKVLTLLLFSFPFFLLTQALDKMFLFSPMSGLAINFILLGLSYFIFLHLLFKPYLLLLIKIVK